MTDQLPDEHLPTEPTSGSPKPSIDLMLEEAQVLQHEYDDYDSARARARIAQRAAPRTCLHGPGRADTRPTAARALTCAPTCSSTDRETAARDLHLAVSLVVGDPRAADALARLTSRKGAETDGALVFACLLHLVGHTEAAQFWWQYAAGGESHTAAFCLYLYHRYLGEHRDARYWRDQAQRLAQPDRPAATRPARSVALLPDSVRLALLHQCHQGRPPHLPPALEAVINSLQVEEHADFGALPQPAPALADHLTGAVR